MTIATDRGGEERTIGLGNFTITALCQRHNSALSAVDNTGVLFSRALKRANALLTGGTILREPLKVKLDGRLLERWFLKTFVNLAIREAGDCHWGDDRATATPPPHLVRAVFGLADLRHPQGLYDINIPGRTVQMENNLGLLTITDADLRLLGGRFDFHILLYLLWLNDTAAPSVGTDRVVFMGNVPETTCVYHNALGVWRGASASVEFHIDWGNSPASPQPGWISVNRPGRLPGG